MLKDNPAFIEAFSGEGYKLYTPVQATEYHMSRHVEATKQSIYAAAGATVEVIQAHMDAIIERCNLAQDSKTFKTDCAALANALKYRTQYPIDANCAIRMGAILCFMEYEQDGKLISENPDKTEIFWLNKKERMADGDPDLWAFFLSMGIVSVPQWSNHLGILKAETYFSDRRKAIAALLPMNLQNLSH